MNNNQPNSELPADNGSARSQRVSSGKTERKLDRLTNILNNVLKDSKFSGVKGKKLSELKEDLREKNKESDQIKEFMDMMKNMTKSTSKTRSGQKRNRNLLNRALTRFDINKIRNSTNRSVSDIVKELELDVPQIMYSFSLTKAEALELIALDDWTDVLTSIVTKALPYAGMAKDIYDTGKGIYDSYRTQVSVPVDPSSMYKEIYAPTLYDVTQTRARVGASTKMKFRYDWVDIPTICNQLNPESYKGVSRFDDVLPAAPFQVFFEIPVIPSATTGAGFVLINLNPYPASLQSLASLVTYTTATNTYNPVSGAYITTAGTITYVDNGVSTQVGAGNLQQVRASAAAISYESTVPVNTTNANGQIEIWHDSALDCSPAPFASTGSNVTQTNVGLRPFYQRGPVTTSYNQLYYNDLDNQPFISVLTSTGGVVAPIMLILSGGNTNSVQVGVLTVRVIYNVTPGPNGYSTFNMQNPGFGPATGDLLSSLYTVAPDIWMAPQSVRSKICSALVSLAEPTFESVINTIMSFEVNAKYKATAWSGNYSL
jgi:hypothetical protein